MPPHVIHICALLGHFGLMLYLFHQETTVTLRNLWSLKYQVLLSYDDQTAARHNELWPPIPYLWANKPTAEELLDFLEWEKSLGRPGERTRFNVQCRAIF